MTQINNKDILDKTITGASVASEYGLYDETKDYAVNDECWLDGRTWTAVNAITGVEKNDMSQAPSDTNTDWVVQYGIVFAVFPATSQQFHQTRITVKYDQIRYDNAAMTLDTVTGEITINKGGGYIVQLTQTNTDTSTNDRSTSHTRIQVDNQSGGGFVDVPNFKISGYHRNSTDGETTGSSSIPLLFSDGDKIRVQCNENDNSGTCATVPEGSNLTIWAPAGSRGPKGDTGADGVLTANFYELLDTPVNYAGAENRIVTVKNDASGIDFGMNGILVPEYELISIAATPLTAMDEVSMNVNGEIQKYPATGGSGSSEFTTRATTLTKMEYFSGNTGAVFYTEGNAIAYMKPGVAQPNGSVVWGTETSITLPANITEISSCKVSDTVVAVQYLTSNHDIRIQLYTTDGTTLTAGTLYTPRDGSNAWSGGIAMNSRGHLVSAYTNNSNMYYQYAEVSGTNLNYPYSERTHNNTPGTPVKVLVDGENDNITAMYIDSNGVAYFQEVQWNKPAFGTGRYDDYNGAEQIVTGGVKLGGFVTVNSRMYGQIEISAGNWQTYYSNFNSGSSIDTPATYGASIPGLAAVIFRTTTGALYNEILNNARHFEIWQGDGGTNSFSKIYTDSTEIVGVTTIDEMDVTLFGSTYATLIQESTFRNTVFFIDSNATRTDNYIGNVALDANPGETVSVLLGLPIICHPIAYNIGDIFHMGPYKYQAITQHQVVMIIEETIFP